MRATEDQIGQLAPNALLIVAVIDALQSTGSTASPKSDVVGWMAGRRDGAWVHRHGKDLDATEGLGLATLSVNGHCFLTRDGHELAARLRSGPPTSEPPARCSCGAGREGPCMGGRQLFSCGVVSQFCPDAVPGLPKAEIAPRSRKAQHEGVWFTPNGCPVYAARRGRGPAERFSETFDGTRLVPGLPVLASHGSGARHLYGEEEGTVLAAAGGTALVSWPAVRGRPAVVADIVGGHQLVLPGALDLSGLTDYQQEVSKAALRGDGRFEQEEGGAWTGYVDGRKVHPRTMEILAERGLFNREPAADAENAPAAPGPR